MVTESADGIARRYLIVALAGILGVPRAAEAQDKPRVYRVGYLSLAPGPFSRSEAFRRGLRELGYAEGQNIIIDERFAAGDAEQSRKHLLDLIRLHVDVIVTA